MLRLFVVIKKPIDARFISESTFRSIYAGTKVDSENPYYTVVAKRTPLCEPRRGL